MTLDSTSINGLDADIVFDTGAGVNIISDSLAGKFGLIPLEAYNYVMGIGKQRTQYAIAREYKRPCRSRPIIFLKLRTGRSVSSPPENIDGRRPTLPGGFAWK